MNSIDQLERKLRRARRMGVLLVSISVLCLAVWILCQVGGNPNKQPGRLMTQSKWMLRYDWRGIELSAPAISIATNNTGAFAIPHEFNGGDEHQWGPIHAGWIVASSINSSGGLQWSASAIHYWNLEASLMGVSAFWIGLLGFVVFWKFGRRTRLPGMCPICGYDLRASPDRCPECGTEVPSKV
jgi:hypothetical protein